MADHEEFSEFNPESRLISGEHAFELRFWGVERKLDEAFVDEALNGTDVTQKVRELVLENTELFEWALGSDNEYIFASALDKLKNAIWCQTRFESGDPAALLALLEKNLPPIEGRISLESDTRVNISGLETAECLIRRGNFDQRLKGAGLLGRKFPILKSEISRPESQADVLEDWQWHLLLPLLELPISHWSIFMSGGHDLQQEAFWELKRFLLRVYERNVIFHHQAFQWYFTSSIPEIQRLVIPPIKNLLEKTGVDADRFIKAWQTSMGGTNQDSRIFQLLIPN